MQARWHDPPASMSRRRSQTSNDLERRSTTLHCAPRTADRQSENKSVGSASYVGRKCGTTRICSTGRAAIDRSPTRRAHSSKLAARCCSGRMGLWDRDGHRTVT